MAIKSVVYAYVDICGDGTSTTYSFDLTKHPFATTIAGSVGIHNFFSDDRPYQHIAPLPIGVAAFPGATGYTVSLSGTVVTITWDTAPASGVSATGTAYMCLLFDAD